MSLSEKIIPEQEVSESVMYEIIRSKGSFVFEIKDEEEKTFSYLNNKKT